MYVYIYIYSKFLILGSRAESLSNMHFSGMPEARVILSRGLLMGPNPAVSQGRDGDEAEGSGRSSGSCFRHLKRSVTELRSLGEKTKYEA